MISQKDLKKLLFYAPETGEFVWRSPTTKGIKPGRKAGCKNTENLYIKLQIFGCVYQAHRLAWLYFYGEMPDGQVDHINGDRTDNRIENLRLATPSENGQNKRKCGARNSTGYLGATFHKQSGKFQAQIKYDGKARHLGLYDTPEQAAAVYLKAKREHHPFCTI